MSNDPSSAAPSIAFSDKIQRTFGSYIPHGYKMVFTAPPVRSGVYYYTIVKKESPKMKTPSEWIEDQYCTGRAAVGGDVSPPFGRTTAIMAYLDALAIELPSPHIRTMKRLQENYPIGVQSHADLQRALNEKTAECERQRQHAEALRGDRAELIRKLDTAESKLRMIQSAVTGVKPL